MHPGGRSGRSQDSGHPGPRRRRLPDGAKVSFLPHGDMDKYLVCNADESEPGTFKDRELMREEPAHAHRGHHDRVLRAAGIQRSFIYIRGEYHAPGRHSSRRDRRSGTGAGYIGDDILGVRLLLLARPAPRRRRLHLRRGDRAARLARGQARQPAAQAAVPGDRGPVRRADADQQRRDAVHGAAHRRAWAAPTYAKLGTEKLDRDEAGLDQRRRAAARQLRDRARHPVREII